MVVRAVHRSAGKGRHAADGQAVRRLLCRNAERTQQRGGRGQAVALLHAEPGRVDKVRRPLPPRGHHRQRRQQVGAVGHIHALLPRRLEPLKQVFYNAVALCGVFVQPAHLHAISEEAHSVPEARLRPVGLHRRVKEAVDRRRHGKAFRFSVYLHAGPRERVARHGDIVAALEPRGRYQRRAAAEQRQREKQPREKLARDVARQPVLPRRQRTAHGKRTGSLFIGNAFFVKEVQIWLLRALHQPPAAGEYAPARDCQRDGNEKAQRRAGLAAVKARKLRKGFSLAADAGHAEGTFICPLPACAERRHAAQRRLDVLRERDILDRAHAVRERGGQQQAVRHRLARRRRDRAREGVRSDTNIHPQSPRPAAMMGRSSVTGILFSSQPPMALGTTMVMLSPLRFLSASAAFASASAG